MPLDPVFADDPLEAPSIACSRSSALAYIWVTSAYLEALPDAKGLYEKHGFESIPPKPGHDEVIATMIARPR